MSLCAPDTHGSVELRRYSDPQGIVRNVQLSFGDSPFMFSIRPDAEVANTEKAGEMPRVSIYLYCEDADRMFDQAVAHGAAPLYRPEDQDYGSREGWLVDPFGITWWIATHLG